MMLICRRPLALLLVLLFAAQGTAVAAAAVPLPAVAQQAVPAQSDAAPCHGSRAAAPQAVEAAQATQNLPCCDGVCPDMLGCVLSVLAPVALNVLPVSRPALSWLVPAVAAAPEAPGHAALRPPIRL